jgi:hypothetical protein
MSDPVMSTGTVMTVMTVNTVMSTISPSQPIYTNYLTCLKTNLGTLA